jgi:hypothetical protein
MAKVYFPISDDHLRAIGRITVLLEYLQSEMLFWTWELIDAGQVIGQVVTAGSSFKATVRTLGALGKERLRMEDHERLCALLKNAERHEERRNQIVHSIWAGGGEAPMRLKRRASVRGLVIESNERLTAKQIDAIADQIEQTFISVQGFFVRLLTHDRPGQPPVTTPSP